MVIYNVPYREGYMNELDEGPTSSSPLRRWGLVAFLVIVIAAFMTRLMPLALSSYPFNNDSLTECALASRILGSGHLIALGDSASGASHSAATPGLSLLLSFISGALGFTPFQCAQIVNAMISMLTVSGVFLLGKTISGSLRGGVAAGLGGVMLGTFVYTSGSAWDESLGVGLLALTIFCFIQRGDRRYRTLCFGILMILPVVHHLVAVIALLSIAFPLVWRMYYGVTNRTLNKHHFYDIVLVVIPFLWTGLYYFSVSFDRIETLSSPKQTILASVSFVLLTMVAIFVLRRQNHMKFTFAPLLALGIVVLLTLDYVGFVFPYNPTASIIVMILVVSYAVLFGLAWYGTEMALERYPRYRVIQVGLLLSPATIIGYSLLNGFTVSSLQISYRTFDFVDIFIFVGIGIALAHLGRISGRRAYHIVGFAVVTLLVLSFPFGYASQQLLGVRHDTQAYEVDALQWISMASNRSSPDVQSDERIAYIGLSMFGLVKDNDLPSSLEANISWPPGFYFVHEQSWSYYGVNNYPHGNVVVSSQWMTELLGMQNVMYIGGGARDQLVLWEASGIGEGVNHWYVPEA